MGEGTTHTHKVKSLHKYVLATCCSGQALAQYRADFILCRRHCFAAKEILLLFCLCPPMAVSTPRFIRPVGYLPFPFPPLIFTLKSAVGVMVTRHLLAELRVVLQEGQGRSHLFLGRHVGMVTGEVRDEDCDGHGEDNYPEQRAHRPQHLT